MTDIPEVTKKPKNDIADCNAEKSVACHPKWSAIRGWKRAITVTFTANWKR